MTNIINDVTHKEVLLLEKYEINWYPYHILDGDNNVAIDDEEEYQKALKLLKR